jgi:single-stranded DNA-binding protein
MTTDKKPVVPTQTITVSCWKDPELKTSKSGREYANISLVAETESGETVFMTGMAFAPLSTTLASLVTKGTRLKAKGKIVEKEYQNKDGETKVGTTLFIASAKLVINGKSVEVDEFTTMDELPVFAAVKSTAPASQDIPF